MAGTNQFLPFASGPGANALTAAAWAALATRQSGFGSGIAPSVQFNTAWRQPSNMAAIIGQFIADAGFNALDDGDLQALQDSFTAAIIQTAGAVVPGLQRVHTGQDTGNANSIVATVSPAITAYEFLAFYELRIAAANTGPVTATLNDLTARPVLRCDGTQLQANDLAAGQIVTLGDNGTALQIISPVFGQYVQPVQSKTLYVAPQSGSDSNPGTQALPAKTIDGALAIGRSYYLSGGSLVIQLATTTQGPYAAPTTLSSYAGRLTIIGNTAAQTNYVIEGAGPAGGNSGVIEAANMGLTLIGLTVNNLSTTNHTVAASSNGSLTLRNVTLLAANGNTQSLVYIAGGCNGILQSGVVFGSSAGTMITVRGSTLTISSNAALSVAGTPTFSVYTAYAADGGNITVRAGATISGSATGKRYFADGGGIIRTSGQGFNFFPGTIAGSVEDIASKYYP